MPVMKDQLNRGDLRDSLRRALRLPAGGAEERKVLEEQGRQGIFEDSCGWSFRRRFAGMSGGNSVVESLPSKQMVAGSSPVPRSI